MKVLILYSDGRLPERATRGSAGLDLFSSKPVVVPGSRIVGQSVEIGRALVPTGIAVEIPRGCVGKIASRSGLSVGHNIEVGAGWIDPDYRGELKVELKNLGWRDFKVRRGDRIAQLLVITLKPIKIRNVRVVSSSGRGSGGFGSTGRH